MAEAKSTYEAFGISRASTVAQIQAYRVEIQLNDCMHAMVFRVALMIVSIRKAGDSLSSAPIELTTRMQFLFGAQRKGMPGAEIICESVVGVPPLTAPASTIKRVSGVIPLSKTK